ncbi:hypothetical protein ElyMa_002611900 [Elysia marginata]|uniref:Uncharacterized protein n=1 Tax=Elysia marginata TaxID=1093978 RepID=A0AAV4H615_9GAST|nr:hypothetical protein ElyMa_002611900 [Elysia marginata]
MSDREEPFSSITVYLSYGRWFRRNLRIEGRDGVTCIIKKNRMLVYVKKGILLGLGMRIEQKIIALARKQLTLKREFANGNDNLRSNLTPNKNLA